MKKFLCVFLCFFLVGCNTVIETNESFPSDGLLNKNQIEGNMNSSEKANATIESQTGLNKSESSEVAVHDPQKWAGEQDKLYYLMADAVIKYSAKIKTEMDFLFLNQARFALVEITDDDIPELLFLIPNWGHSSVYLFSCTDIESNTIKCIEPHMTAKAYNLPDFQIEIYKNETDIILQVPDLDSSYNVHEDIMRYYRVSNNAITPVAATCYQWVDEEDKNERYYADEWYNAEKRISREEYDAYSQTILEGYQKIQDVSLYIEVADYMDGDNLYLALKALYADYKAKNNN